MFFPKGSKPSHARPHDLRHPLADEAPKFAYSADCRLTVPSVAVVAPLYSHQNVTSAPGYPSGNIAVNITTANRGKGWPKQKPQAAPTHHSSIFSMHDKIGTTPTCRKYIKTPRENTHNPSPCRRASTISNRYHRRDGIEQ